MSRESVVAALQKTLAACTLEQEQGEGKALTAKCQQCGDATLQKKEDPSTLRLTYNLGKDLCALVPGADPVHGPGLTLCRKCAPVYLGALAYASKRPAQPASVPLSGAEQISHTLTEVRLLNEAISKAAGLVQHSASAPRGSLDKPKSGEGSKPAVRVGGASWAGPSQR